MSRVTQREVALRAGVSRATVSYVLGSSQTGKERISAVTRRKVLEAAQELGYQPDASAQTLRSGKSWTVGVLVPDMNNPHFWQILSGIEREAHRHGYTLLVFHSSLIKSEEDVGLRELARRRIDGLVTISSFPPTWPQSTKAISESRLPVVDLSNVESPFDRVVADYHTGTKQLVEHLIELGHRRIGFVYGAPSYEVGLDRLDPYRETLGRHGLPAAPELVVQCGTTTDDAYRSAGELLSVQQPPTAVIALNDLLALGVMRAASDRGLSIPAELSVAGFDDIPFARMLTPRLTTVHRDTELAGERAFALLFERMANPELPLRTEQLESRLIVRESTGQAPS